MWLGSTSKHAQRHQFHWERKPQHARGSYQMNTPLVGDTALTTSQTTMLANRTRVIISSEAMSHRAQRRSGRRFLDLYQFLLLLQQHRQSRAMARLIDATVAWMQTNYPLHRIVAVSPFNDPTTYIGTRYAANFKEIAKRLKENYPSSRISPSRAGNTLNNDNALAWYNGVKPYVTLGATPISWQGRLQLRQLLAAGCSRRQLPLRRRASQHRRSHDRCQLWHESRYMVGLRQQGAWQFCQISNHGSQIAYAENRPAWSVASVYRNDENGD
jgi:hypothetical protein